MKPRMYNSTFGNAERKLIGAGKTIKMTGYVCVYAIGPEAGRPLKVGYAAELIARIKGMQAHNWNKIGAHTARWVANLALARELERECHHVLLPKRITGEWFDVNVSEAEAAMSQAVKSSGVSAMAHDDMLRHMEPYREFVKFPNLFWPNARRLSSRCY